MEQHRFYKQAYNAYAGTSQVPEERAPVQLKWFDSVIEEMKKEGKEWAIEKFEKLWLKHMAAKSRVFSVLVTGGSNFPVARMQKYNRWERAAGDAVDDFIKKVFAPPVAPRTELDYAIEEKEYMIGDVTVKHNTEQNRLQLIFPGKPDPDMIAKLKSRGFKWSPRNTAWQRQLTPNALAVVPYILKQTA